MATLARNNLTLADWAKATDPDGSVASVAELLSQTNEILVDAVFKEGNLPTGDRVSIRTGLPSVYWRAMNQGIPSSKSTSAQVDEACGMLEARSEIDKDLAELNGNSASFRLGEDSAFLEAMNQTQAETMFYGNPTVDPKTYLGLAPRYSSLAAANGANVISAGGAAADNTSVWLVLWGEQTVYCPFPKGSKAGLMHEDLGEQTVYNSDGTRMQALATRYQWKNGLVVKDHRYAVRICNVSTTDLLSGTNTQAPAAASSLIKLMTRATYKIPNMKLGRPCFYMNRTCHTGLSISALDKSQSVLKINEALSQFGTSSSYLSFLGVPIRLCDALLNTEDTVA